MVRQRTTIQLESLDVIDTDNLLLDEEQIKIPARLYRHRQDKLVLKIDELPSDLQQLLSEFYLIRMQWSSPDSQRDELFQNFEVDGLSINLVPGIAEYEPLFDKFGDYVKRSFNVTFDNFNLISLPTSALFHSNQQLKSSIIDRFLRKLVTEGLDRISFLTNFELVYQNKELSIQWISSPYDLSILKSSKIRKEVALLQTNKLENELELSGIRIVLDESESLPPTKTLLFVKNRHHSLKENPLTISFQEPIGLHPTLTISGFNEESLKPPHDSCELFLYNTISNDLFFDSYQYDEKKLKLINSWGESNLELPIWKISKFGSVQLFQLNYKNLLQNKELEIKFHSRYLKPSADNNFKLFTPEIFWACDSSEFIEDFEEISNSPFDSFGLGYESLFEDNTNFFHLSKNKRVLDYEIPTGDIEDFDSIQFITLISVIFGVFYIFTKIVNVLRNTDDNDNDTDEKKDK